MLVATGYFDARGNPCLKVSIAGVFIAPPGLEFEAIIDTGFSGFLCLPMVRAFPLGLPLYGTSSAVLADGSVSTCLTALCKLTLGGQMKQGVVLLQSQAKDALIGMDFLRKFGVSLFMTKSAIALLDEKALDEMMKKQAQAQEAAAKAQKAVLAKPDEAKPAEQQKPSGPDSPTMQ